MPITIRQLGPCFAGEVDGVDISKPLSKADADAIHAGMDKYAVLVFHDQHINDEQQLAFTQKSRRHRARDRHQPARGRGSSPANDLRGRVQSRQEQQAVRTR